MDPVVTEPLSTARADRTLRSVHGRPAFFEYLRMMSRHRGFTWYSAVQQLRSENVKAAIGSFWFLLTPLLNIIVYWLVFGKLLNANRGAGNYITFLTIGILMFDLLARPLPGASRLLETNITLIRSVYFPRAVLPLAFSIENLIRFLPSILVMVFFVLAGGESVRWSWLLLIPAVLIAYTFMLGLSLIFARIGKMAVDVGLALPHLIRLLLYGSGVLYLPSSFTQDERVLAFFNVNPFFEILSIVRGVFIEAQPASTDLWIGATAWALGSLAVGLVFFWQGEPGYGE